MNFLFGSKAALIEFIPPECRKLGWNDSSHSHFMIFGQNGNPQI